MSQLFRIHPATPQPRLVGQAASLLRAGALIVYPTDSCYAFGCMMGNKAATERARRLRGIDERHLMTLVCRDLSEIATYAKVDNTAFRLLRAHTPGPYTFILRATRDVPRRLQHPKRRTIGLRVPDHPVAAALLEALGEPLMSTTCRLAGQGMALSDPDDVIEQLSGDVELVIESGACGVEPTSVVDLTEVPPRIVRRGRGDLRAFERA